MKKRVLTLLLSCALVLSLAACSSGGGSDSSSGSPEAGGASSSGTGSTSHASNPQPAPDAALTQRPVQTAGGTFIVQDETTSQYGLMDASGQELLPCQYGDLYYLYVNQLEPKTYVAVQDKGSYGVYDLTGRQVIAPRYDGISGALYNDAFLVEYHDAWGAVNLSGGELLPVQYDAVADSVQHMYAALTSAGGSSTSPLPSHRQATSRSTVMRAMSGQTGRVAGKWKRLPVPAQRRSSSPRTPSTVRMM